MSDDADEVERAIRQAIGAGPALTDADLRRLREAGAALLRPADPEPPRDGSYAAAAAHQEVAERIYRREIMQEPAPRAPVLPGTYVKLDLGRTAPVLDGRVVDVDVRRNGQSYRQLNSFDGPLGYQRAAAVRQYEVTFYYEGDGFEHLYEILRSWPYSAPQYLEGRKSPVREVGWSAEQKAAREQLRKEKAELAERLRRSEALRMAAEASLERADRERLVLRAGLTRRLPEHSVAFPRELSRVDFLEIDPDLPVKHAEPATPSPPAGVERDRENGVNICRNCDQVVEGERCYTCRPLTRVDFMEIE